MDDFSKIDTQICKRCVMDTSDKDIKFNDLGVCNHCIEAEELLPKYNESSENSLKIDSIVRKIKTQKGNYNCLIGLSGGVDSSYVALLAKKWGLNPLCLHFDNGWNSDISVKNIQNIIKHTGFHYETVVINWPEFKSLQRAYIKAGVVDIEALTDHAIFASMIKITKQEKIRYILSGTNYVTEHGMPPSWSWHKLDLRNIKAINKKYGDRKKLNSFPMIGTLRWLMLRKFGLRLEFLEPLNHIPFNKEQAMKELKDNFDWEYYGGKHYESVFTRFYQAYILPKKFKIDKRRVHLSALIRSGQIGREKALYELTLPLYEHENLKKDLDFVSKKLNFSKPELKLILDKEPVPHHAFPSDRIYIEPLLKIAKAIGFKTFK